MIIIEVEVPPYKNGQFSIWCPDYGILWRGSQQTLRLLSTWIPVGDFVQKVSFSNVLAESNATFTLSQFARLFPTGFPKSSLLDGDFVLLDVERKGAIDFRSLILACRLRRQETNWLQLKINYFLYRHVMHSNYILKTPSHDPHKQIINWFLSGWSSQKTGRNECAGPSKCNSITSSASATRYDVDVDCLEQNEKNEKI